MKDACGRKREATVRKEVGRGFIMGHSRRQALALIDLWVMQRAQPRGPLEGSLGCKYNSVFLLHRLGRDTDKGGSDRKKRE